ncbi:MAG TPA: hypothetical protein PLJ21_13615, partial [Pseudobdellovibrionaceae bacterium]|nr:hypothetical protein [Pseudobdellovibrionaceae bacterium]
MLRMFMRWHCIFKISELLIILIGFASIGFGATGDLNSGQETKECKPFIKASLTTAKEYFNQEGYFSIPYRSAAELIADSNRYGVDLELPGQELSE